MKKEGQFYVIDVIDGFKLVEVDYVGEDKPVYKIFSGKNCVYKFTGRESLHGHSDYYISNSLDYDEYVNWLDEHHPDLEWEKFGNQWIPSNSLLGTSESPTKKYLQRKPTTTSNKYDPYGLTDERGFYTGGWTNNYWQPKPEVVDEDKVKELTKSNTIVFHLDDASTVMLKQIYEGKGFDVVTRGLNTPTTAALMDAHERIICLGHGTGHGLIGMFGTEVREHFKDKKIFTIWCNADKYFNDGGVGQGAFITGNMPSEVWECRAAGCGNISAELMLENITYWSKLCADKVEDCLAGNVRESVNYIRREYIKKYGDHPVTHYNSVRTFVLGDSYEQAEQEVKAIEDELGIHPDWNKYNPQPQVTDKATDNKTTDTVNTDDSTGNKELDAGIKFCIKTIQKQIEAINGPTSFDLKSVSAADEGFYNYLGNLLINRLKPIYPEYNFFLNGSVISWQEN